jgi:NTE family protein
MKVGLMLGGGGAKGAYQLGVLKALEQYNLINQIDCISGASIGALNGYFYLSSLNINQVIDSWRYGINNNPIQIKKRNRKKEENETGLFSLQVLREMNKMYLDPHLFEQTKIDLFVSTTKVVNPKLSGVVMRWKWENDIIHLNQSDIPFEDAISSSSVPIVFGTNRVRNSYYIDGGLTNNNPVDILINQGCDVILGVSLDNKCNYKKYKEHHVTLINLTSPEAMPKTAIKRYVAALNFNLELFENRIEYGYYATTEMIKECISKGVFKLDHQQVKICENGGMFKIIDVPDYINANIKIMCSNKESQLRKKERNHGNN